MAKVVKIKSPVTIRYKQLANGNQSVYLDIYRDGKRIYKFLKLYIVPGKDPASRANNENVMRAAVAAQAQVIRDIAEGTGGIVSQHQSSMTLDELCVEYMAYKESAGLNIGDYRNLRVFMRNNNFDTTQIKSIDTKWFHKFVTALKNYVSPSSKRPFSQTTIHIRIQLVREILKYAYQKKYINTDAADTIDKADKVAKADKERQYLTKDELTKLIDTPFRYPQIKNMFLFSCFTGLRFIDIATLRVKDIVKTNEGHAIHKFIIKPKKWQWIPLNANAMKYIDIENRDGEELVFPNVYDRMTHWYCLREWVKAAGINKYISFHCARHTFATLALTLGADLYTVSKLLGHANITTTQIYAKIVDEKKVEAVNLLDKI